MSIGGPSKPGPYDKIFDPTPYSKGASFPKGVESISYNKGKAYMENGTVLLHSETRDSMVKLGQEKGQSTKSDGKNLLAKYTTQAAYEKAYKTMSKHGIDDKEQRKLDGLERNASIADLKVDVDKARRALGRYTEQAASDSKLEPAEQQKIKILKQKMSIFERALGNLEDQDSRADREDRKLDRMERKPHRKPSRPTPSDTNGMIGDDGSA